MLYFLDALLGLPCFWHVQTPALPPSGGKLCGCHCAKSCNIAVLSRNWHYTSQIRSENSFRAHWGVYLNETKISHRQALDTSVNLSHAEIGMSDVQTTEILALRREEDELREHLKAAAAQQTETEIALEAVRLDASNKRAEQERQYSQF